LALCGKGADHFRSLALGELATAQIHLEDVAAAVANVDTALEIVRHSGRRSDVLAELLGIAAEAHARAGDIATAERYANELIDIIDADESAHPRTQVLMWTAAQAYRTAGDDERARRLADRSRAFLVSRTAALEDEKDRAAYRALWANRQIATAQAPTRFRKASTKMRRGAALTRR
jgi:hypothetical protein